MEECKSKMNGPYNAIEMEVLENPGYETEGTDGKILIIFHLEQNPSI